MKFWINLEKMDLFNKISTFIIQINYKKLNHHNYNGYIKLKEMNDLFLLLNFFFIITNLLYTSHNSTI